VTLERAVLIEAPWWNDAGRAVADMTTLPGARVVGEHLHPALHESFTVREGELTVLRDGQRSIVRAGERADIEPGVWHD
jgi:quercetin dioxygenase-like cupin family protein